MPFNVGLLIIISHSNEATAFPSSFSWSWSSICIIIIYLWHAFITDNAPIRIKKYEVSISPEIPTHNHKKVNRYALKIGVFRLPDIGQSILIYLTFFFRCSPVAHWSVAFHLFFCSLLIWTWYGDGVRQWRCLHNWWRLLTAFNRPNA